MTKRHCTVSNRSLGIALFVALAIQFILPQVGINFQSLATLIYLIVAIDLIFCA